MRRSAGERLGEDEQVNAVSGLERALAKPVLLSVMVAAKADAPPVRRLEGNATIGSAADMGAFDRDALAAGHRAMVLSHPCAMRSARAGSLSAALFLDSAWQPQLSHPPAPIQLARMSCVLAFLAMTSGLYRLPTPGIPLSGIEPPASGC